MNKEKCEDGSVIVMKDVNYSSWMSKDVKETVTHTAIHGQQQQYHPYTLPISLYLTEHHDDLSTMHVIAILT